MPVSRPNIFSNAIITKPMPLPTTTARNWIPTGTNAPDYAVFDESVQYRRDEANLAAGYFDIAWELDESLGVFR